MSSKGRDAWKIEYAKWAVNVRPEVFKEINRKRKAKGDKLFKLDTGGPKKPPTAWIKCVPVLLFLFRAGADTFFLWWRFAVAIRFHNEYFIAHPKPADIQTKDWFSANVKAAKVEWDGLSPEEKEVSFILLLLSSPSVFNSVYLWLTTFSSDLRLIQAWYVKPYRAALAEYQTQKAAHDAALKELQTTT